MHHMDNTSEIIESVGALVHFLPPYSPDLNPIEEAFSKVKGYLKANDMAIQAVPDSELEDFILAGFASITPEDRYGWFRHSGYV